MESNPSSIQSLQRAFSIVEILSDHPHGMGLTELAVSMNLSKSTVHRFLASLVALGYVFKSPADKYHLTLRLYEIGSRSVKSMDIMEIARPLLDRLAEDVGMTAHLATLSDAHVLYLYKKSASSLSINTRSFIGSSAPVYCTGIGKAIMAYRDGERALQIWNRQNIVQYTANTITNWQDFQLELERVRAAGYAVDHEEYELGVCCIALPVFDYLGAAKYAVSLTFSKTRLNSSFVAEKISALENVARQLSAFCGAGSDGS